MASSASPVRIEDEAFSDQRIELLGAICGYNRFEALGRLAHLWRYCTRRGEYVVSPAIVAACLGDRGPEAILESELGQVVGDGIRIRGTEGRIEWRQEYAKQTSSGKAAGGRARVQNAHRDERGRLVSKSYAGPSSPPAGAPAGPADAGEPPSRPIQRSGHADPIHRPTVQHHQQGDSSITSRPPAGPAAPTLTLPPEETLPRARAIPPTPVPVAAPKDPQHANGRTDPARPEEIKAHAALVKHAMAEVDAIRKRVAARFGWTDVRPLHPMDDGRGHLLERIAEDPEHAEPNIRHVLEVAEAEAIAKRTVEWLTGAMFKFESWRKKLGMRVEDARRAAKSASPASSPTMRIADRDEDDAPLTTTSAVFGGVKP